MSARRLASAVLVALAVVVPATAETPVEAARALIARYDEDPARLDRARDLLEAALQHDRDVATMTLLSRVYFLIGDVRATTTDAKLAAYAQGRDIGRRAVELAPRDAQAHLWYAVNMGRWGQTKGVMRSLFLLPTLREELDTIFRLDPRLPGAHDLAGNVAFEVPGWMGGDRKKAEEHFRTGLDIDPHFTGLRVDLARLYAASGRRDEARQELQRVLDERTPTSIADWTVKDLPRARKLLDSVGAK